MSPRLLYFPSKTIGYSYTREPPKVRVEHSCAFRIRIATASRAPLPSTSQLNSWRRTTSTRRRRDTLRDDVAIRILFVAMTLAQHERVLNVRARAREAASDATAASRGDSLFS